MLPDLKPKRKRIPMAVSIFLATIGMSLLIQLLNSGNSSDPEILSEPQITQTAISTPTPTPLISSIPEGLGPQATFRIVNIYPHDPQAFTQGLIFHDNFLYESTGLLGQSSLRKVNLDTGAILQKTDLPENYFFEGMTIWQDTLISLTWKSKLGFVYDLNTFETISEFHYETEGWGLTHDDKTLIMSDGTSAIYFLDPITFQVVKTIVVTDNDSEVVWINELEYVKGEIYANIWQTDKIARIDPQSGKVLGWINLSGLLPPESRKARVDVLNGIAYDSKTDRLFVTGKWWPQLFEIALTNIY